MEYAFNIEEARRIFEEKVVVEVECHKKDGSWKLCQSLGQAEMFYAIK